VSSRTARWRWRPGEGFDLDEVDGSGGTTVCEVDLGKPCRLDPDLERAAGADGSPVDENYAVLLVEVLLMVVAGENQELALTVALAQAFQERMGESVLVDKKDVWTRRELLEPGAEVVRGGGELRPCQVKRAGLEAAVGDS
jgi:hypothetical protein